MVNVTLIECKDTKKIASPLRIYDIFRTFALNNHNINHYTPIYYD